MVDPVDDCTVTRIDKDGGRHIVAEIDGDYNHPDTWPVMEANARLIAAAPEMYAVLVMVRDADDDCLRDGLASLPRMARAKLEEAIRKAETGHA